MNYPEKNKKEYTMEENVKSILFRLKDITGELQKLNTLLERFVESQGKAVDF